MRSLGPLLAVGFCAGALLMACSDSQAGTALPGDPSAAPTSDSGSTTSRPTTQPTNSSSLDGIEPCELLSESDRAQYRLDPGKPKVIARSKTCYWDSDGEWAVGLGLKASLAFKDADLRGATPIRVSMARHEAHRVEGAGGASGSCEIFIITGESSFAQVTAVTRSGRDMALACEGATAIAKIIDPKLP